LPLNSFFPYPYYLFLNLLYTFPSNNFQPASRLYSVPRDISWYTWYDTLAFHLENIHFYILLSATYNNHLINSQPMPTYPFTGRKPDLEFLHDQFQQISQGQSRIILISAPAGTGKTALVRHFLQTVDNDCTHAEGRGWDNRAAVSYHALRETLRQLPALPDAPDPLMRAFLDDRPHHKTGHAYPEDLFPRLADFLRTLTHLSPLCLFLDDLQWADEGTYEWIDFAFRELADAPILWLGAYRSEEAGSLKLLMKHSGRWHQTGRFTSRLLDPLSRLEVEELAHRTMPPDLCRQETLDRIWKRSEGLGLLTVEEIRACLEGREDSTGGQAFIDSRLDALSPEDRQLLSMAAVMGERFEPTPLAAVLERDILPVVQQLEKLCREQALLVADNTGFRFSHSRFRESLLESMSPSLRQAYHARLAEQVDTISTIDRTYHLVGSGNVDESVRALLKERDRGDMTWRDAQRYDHEALSLLQASPQTPDPELYLAVYQHLGDLQLTILYQHEIARPYYEAARCFARTPREHLVVLCRLIECSRIGTPHQRQLLEEALEIAEEVGDPGLLNWVEFRRITCRPGDIPLNRQDWLRIRELGRQAKPIPDLHPYFFILLQGTYRAALAKLNDFQGVKRELQAQTPTSHLEKFHYHQNFSNFWANMGRFEEARHHLQKARAISKRWHLPTHGGAYGGEAYLFFNIGAYEELCSVFTEMEVEEILEDRTLLILCRIWPYDRFPHALEWTRRYLRGVEAFFTQIPTDGGHLRALLCELGMAERIFRDLDKKEEFQKIVDQMQNRLFQAGYHTEGIWYRDNPVDLPEISPVLPEEWRYENGETLSGICRKDGSIQLRTSPDASTWLHSQIRHKITGDFAFQATIHPSVEVEAGIPHCRQLKKEGRTASLNPGGGGLFIGQGKISWLELCAHKYCPEEVVCSLFREGVRQDLGRALLSDRPIRLRLERRGATISAYTGEEDGSWYLCGQVELPDWGSAEIGLFNCRITDLEPGMVEETESRFWDICLQTDANPLADYAESSDSPYSLPAPSYVPDLPGMVAASPTMLKLIDQVRRTADSFLPVLIQGATGTGKELIARAVHQLGDRASRSFVPLNCASISPELLESELFGHVRGAFTGAYKNRSGLIEVAHRGILFLDEIGDAQPAFQAHLLRVIEEQAIRRVGDQQLRPIDVRLVSATNCDLEQACAEKKFRKDLYFRLKGVTFSLPPLHQRKEDIPHLVAHALQTWTRRRETETPSITCKAMEILLGYHWPGNVRELLRVVEHAAEEAEGNSITPTHLSIQTLPSAPSSGSDQEEYQRITTALRLTEGNLTAAARNLGISRNTIYRKMRQLGIKRPGK
jgi:transcriptional regulator with AAA-type ATPase domain